jgi:hypothetical protein
MIIFVIPRRIVEKLIIFLFHFTYDYQKETKEMGKTIYQTNVIMAKEKDSFESQLNHFLSTLDTDDLVEVQYQENSGIFSALVLFKVER